MTLLLCTTLSVDLNSFCLIIIMHHTLVLVLGVGIGKVQYCWVLDALLCIVLTLIGWHC